MSGPFLRALIVESDPFLARSLRDPLEARGHAIDVVSEITDAFRLELPDVLIARLDGTGRKGLAALETLRGRGLSPRTILVSAAPSITACRDALRAGAQDLLQLPVDADELVRVVEEIDPASESLPGFERTLSTSPQALQQSVLELLAYSIRCGIGPSCRARLATACGEVLDNAYRHAYDGEWGRVRFTAELDERLLLVKIADQGVGFDAGDALFEGLQGFEAGEGARSGLARAAALAESFAIVSRPGAGTTVEMRFAAYRVHFDEERTVDLSELDFFTPQTAKRVLDTLAERGDDGFFHLSPALAVALGRMLAGPDPRRILHSLGDSSGDSHERLDTGT